MDLRKCGTKFQPVTAPPKAVGNDLRVPSREKSATFFVNNTSDDAPSLFRGKRNYKIREEKKRNETKDEKISLSESPFGKTRSVVAS